MKFCIKIGVITVFFLFVSCASFQKDPLNEVLKAKTGIIYQVMQHPKNYEVQIIYTSIKRDKNNGITFKDYTYQLDANQYYYPASTVKFPIAVMALEKLSSLPNASTATEFTIGEDLTKWRFSDEISKLFAVSDNDASNHLFEFIGFEYLNSGMKNKGLTPFRVSHRLSIANSGSLKVAPVTLYNGSSVIAQFPSTIAASFSPLIISGIQKGKGYIQNDQLVNGPFDFSQKNYYPLESLHNTLKRVIFPEAFSEKERFQLSTENREFLLFSMQNLPRNAGYDPKEYFDSYGKFFMFGDSKEPIPEHIKIYNKIGEAYGTLTDCSYIVDTKNNIEFMISATILVNKNEIFNDGVYEYDTVGIPFFAELGRKLYESNKK
jgi:hypothetical protein